ncbi:MAG: hypothetical protein ABUK01_07980 [Leptospirales bacterium]
MEHEEELLNNEDDGFTVDAELTVSIFDRVRKYLAFFSVGLISLIIGAVLFFPTKKIPAYLFYLLRDSGINVNTEQATFSILGDFQVDKLQYLASRSTRLEDLSITQIEGNISLSDYIFSEKIVATFSAIGVRVDFGKKGSLGGGQYSGSIDLNNINKPLSERVGNISLQIKNTGLMVHAIGTNFSFSINNGEIAGELKLGTFHLTQGKVETRSGTILIQGTVGFSGQQALNLKLIVTPNENFYTKSEMLTKESLEFMKALQPDGTIHIKITGNMNNPIVNIEKAAVMENQGNPRANTPGGAPVLGSQR